MNTPDFFAVVAAMMALVLLVDVSVLWLTGRQVPELLSQLIFGVFGFYFGRAPGLGRQPDRVPVPAVTPRPPGTLTAEAEPVTEAEHVPHL